MDNSQKIKTVSTVLQYASYSVVGIILFAVFFFSIMLRWFPEEFMLLTVAKATVMLISEANSITALFAIILLMTPSLLLAYGVWRLGRMFRIFSNGVYFSDVGVSHLLVFTLCGFVAQFFGPVFGALSGLVAALGMSESSVEFTIHIDGLEIVQLMMWATFIIVAWIFREGIRLANENAEFV